MQSSTLGHLDSIFRRIKNNHSISKWVILNLIHENQAAGWPEYCPSQHNDNDLFHFYSLSTFKVLHSEHSSTFEWLVIPCSVKRHIPKCPNRRVKLCNLMNDLSAAFFSWEDAVAAVASVTHIYSYRLISSLYLENHTMGLHLWISEEWSHPSKPDSGLVSPETYCY